ncbi:MAG TPA: amidohydrolase family protein [Gemmatimonadales bacterium]|nr:amidohydrolase family protein [Gemmatimonadales bacterium]
MRIDVNAFLGAYPHRRVPGTSPEALLAAMDRVEISESWVTHLPGLFWRDPHEGNAWLYETVAHQPRFKAVPAIHPGLPRWEIELGLAATRGAPAVRCDPGFLGLDPAGQELRVLAGACGVTQIPLMMAVRLEDVRQRHPNDRSADLTAAGLRALVRADPDFRLIVTHADRALIEDVHWGSTPAERERIWWDISCVWGPPEDHLATLLETIGVERFVFGTGQPLRLPEASVAKLDLLDIPRSRRTAIESGNAPRARAR